MIKIALLTRYSKLGASSRYRFYDYTNYLEGSGMSCMIVPLFDDKYLQAKYTNKGWKLRAAHCYLKRVFDLVLETRDADLLFIEKELFPYVPFFIEKLFLIGKKYVVDYDDAIFHQYDMHRSLFVRRMLSNKIRHIMDNSDLVISGSPYLHQYAVASSSCKSVVIPTVVDTEYYLSVDVKKRDKFTIVWIGSPSTVCYLNEISNALAIVCGKINAELLVIGAKIHIPNVPVTFEKWSPETEIKLLKSSHVGIMPLTDNFWERGKCGFKLIQYMASGIPVVASPIGVNKEIVTDGVNGYLARSNAEWIEAIMRIYRESDALAKNGLRIVSERYSLRSSAPVLKACLSDVIDNHNISNDVVSSFGYEWSRFDNSDLPEPVLNNIWEDYFDIFPWDSLPNGGGTGADIGCGSGRWAQFVSKKVDKLYLIDPSSKALDVAKKNLRKSKNVSFFVSSVNDMPIKDEALDFAYSLGVLHHVPDIKTAFKLINKKLKVGAPFLVYLYYAFDNKPYWYRVIWKASDGIRNVVSKFPYRIRYQISQFFAYTVYFPMSFIGGLLSKAGILPNNWPLAYYIGKPIYIMRNDSLDRFGTSLENRFSKKQIVELFEDSGFSNVVFSDRQPYWCAYAVKCK